mgnify:CR=1 FL=1
MHNNPNNNSRQKDLKAAGQLAPAWQIMRNAVHKQMMAAALGQQSRAAKDNFNVRQQQQLLLPQAHNCFSCQLGNERCGRCSLCDLTRATDDASLQLEPFDL